MEAILVDILTAILVFIIETILLWKFGENIQYGVIYSLNKIDKNIRNLPIKIDYNRISENLVSEIKYENIISIIKEYLTNNNIIYDSHSSEIVISSYEYGSSKLSGKIYFTYNNYKEHVIMNINFEFSKNCNYRTLSDEIFGLVKAVKSLEEKITIELTEKIIYSDVLTCHLSKIKSLTKFFEVFKEKEGFGYLLLPGKMKIQLASNEIVLSDEIDDTGLILLKEMVTNFY
jgi:hypothetical protein